MKLNLLFWSFPIVITLHNLEEALWLPGWSAQQARRWGHSVGLWPFRFAVLVLTTAAFGIAFWAQVQGCNSLGHYLLASYALAQSFNIFIPHLVATIATRSYAPGLLTGICCVWPSSGIILWQTFIDASFSATLFWGIAIIFGSGLLLSLPVLFQIGRFLEDRIAK